MIHPTFQIKALLSKDEFIHYAKDITAHLVNSYPDFPLWFEKVASEIPSPDRKAYVALVDGQTAGITIFKKGYENKLCTLYIKDEFKGYGIGSEFMKNIKRYYDNESFFLTIAEETYLSCEGFFIKNGFIITKIFNSKDKPDLFNGVYLENQNEVILTYQP